MISDLVRLHIIIFFSFFCTGCVTSAVHPDEPVTVMIIYHAKQGRETELKQCIAQAWKVYCHEGGVSDQPHNCVQDVEDGGNRIIEIFTWRGPFTMEWPSVPVKELWKKMHLLCESRGGQLDIEYRYVDRLILN